MTRTFNETMRRLRSYSEGVHPDTGEKLDSTNKTHKLNLDNPGNNKTNKIYNSKKPDYRGLYLHVNSDKTMLLAQSWGMEPGLLYKLCKKYGAQWVKQCIQKTEGIGNRYFRQGEPLEPQRGRYCHKMITRDGKPIC